MNIAKTYELIYTGMTSPQHLLWATKSGITGNAISRADNARAANYLLDMIGFDRDVQAKAAAFHVPGHEVSAVRVADHVRHIHREKSEEIRERFAQPEIEDDEELARILFEHDLREELKDVPQTVEARIGTGH